MLPNYRLYRLDGSGKIIAADWVQAPSDEEALVEAQERSALGSFELWDRERLVRRFRASEGSAGGPSVAPE
ncbi:MAG TPA: hypothetical protein VM308_04220 [Sphingomicrobium sp.]|nr:hypothetical protein [Sphingomicrobium sp.]